MLPSSKDITPSIKDIIAVCMYFVLELDDFSRHKNQSLSANNLYNRCKSEFQVSLMDNILDAIVKSVNEVE